MLTLIGAVLGFVSSAMPEFIKLWRQKADQAHELNILKLQIESDKAKGAQRIEEIQEEGQTRETEALYQISKPTITGVKWVDATLEALNSSVRPVVTYWYFVLYATVKAASLSLLLRSPLSWQQGLIAAWTDTDMAMFATVLGYWFGQRVLAKRLK